MVFVWPNEHHRTILFRDLLAEMVAIVEDRWNAQTHRSDQLGDGIGGPTSAEQQSVLIGSAYTFADDLASLLAKPSGL